MVKINQLDSSVYNRIAAGEVVERPKSVIKELVENSIDAGATEITIEIEDGGKSSIKITDNGCGISREYVATAFLPHATSKISNVEDLDTIATLGFRGEALASIASVSIIELTTRAFDEQVGSRIELKGGEVIGIEDADCNNGTTICVRRLFYNTPAREKFLKKAKSEEGEVTKTISDLILANPTIAFRYYADSSCIFTSTGGGLEDAVFAVYPRSITSKLIPVSYRQGNYSVSGYISTPELTKPNRSYQTAIINGRIIVNSTVSTAISSGYGSALMKRAFPVYVIDVVMPFDELDVNVHPNKTDVRFLDSRNIFSLLYRAVESALSGNAAVFSARNVFDKDNKIKNDVFEPNKSSSDTNNSNIIHNSEQSKVKINATSENDKDNTTHSASDIIISESKVLSRKQNDDISNKVKPVIDDVTTAATKTASTNQREKSTDDTIERLATMMPINKGTVGVSGKITFREPVTDAIYAKAPKKKEEHCESDLFIQAEELFKENYNVIGQIFNTYVIVHKGEYVYLIDQHAAHERLLYDDLSERLAKGSVLSQQLLIPQIIDVSATDAGYLKEIIPELAAIGLDIEEFGANTFKVSAVPSMLISFDLEKFINALLADRNKLSQIKVKNLLHDTLAVTACKAAIKAGDKLNDYQIKALLNLMKDNTPLQCPHGRPAIIAFTRKDIDKLFRRIL